MMRSMLGAAVAILLAIPTAASAHTGPNATRITARATPCTVLCAAYRLGALSPCDTPLPHGSSLAIMTHAAPTPPAGRIVILEVTLDTQLSGWHLTSCPDGGGTSADLLGEPCDSPLGPSNPVNLGCHEDYTFQVAPGGATTLVLTNVYDPGPALLAYWFTIV